MLRAAMNTKVTLGMDPNVRMLYLQGLDTYSFRRMYYNLSVSGVYFNVLLNTFKYI